MTVSGVRGEDGQCVNYSTVGTGCTEHPALRGNPSLWCTYCRSNVVAPAGRGVDGGGDVKCERCAGEHDHSTEFCCSSHGKRLCHDCYKRTHFVHGVCCNICRAKVALGARRDA